MLNLNDALNCSWLKLYHWSSCFEENLIWAKNNMYLTDVKSHPRCVHHRLEKVLNQLEPKWINETLPNLTAGVYNEERVAMHWRWINDCQVLFENFTKRYFFLNTWSVVFKKLMEYKWMNVELEMNVSDVAINDFGLSIEKTSTAHMVDKWQKVCKFHKLPVYHMCQLSE